MKPSPAKEKAEDREEGFVPGELVVTRFDILAEDALLGVCFLFTDCCRLFASAFSC